MTQSTGLPEIDDGDDVVVKIGNNVAEEDFLENKPTPMPKGLKYGLMALSLALIAGLLVMNGLKNSGAGDVIGIGIDGEVLDTSSHIVQSNVSGNISSDSKNDVLQNIDSGSDKSGIGILKLSVTPMALMKEQVESLTSQIQEMSRVINRFEEQAIMVDQLHTQVSGIEEQLKEVTTREEFEQVKTDFSVQFEKKAEELKLSLGRLYKKAKRVVGYKKKPVVMPFRLVSIDQWDGVNYAAIQSTSVGGIENLRQGDTRSGWVVANIDSMKMTVTFEHSKTGKTVTMKTI